MPRDDPVAVEETRAGSVTAAKDGSRFGHRNGSRSQPRRRPRVNLLGHAIDKVTEAQAVDAILDGIVEGRGGWVVTPNLNLLRTVHRQPDLRWAFDEADLVLPDGTPLLWAARLQQTPLFERVTGSNVIWSLSEALARIGGSVYLLGGNPGAADGAAARLVERSPSLRIAGTCCPGWGFEHDEQEIQSIGRDLATARPDVVYLGLPFPKQAQAATRLRPYAPNAWFLGVGVSLSFVSGEIQRAPRWMQHGGLEWIHRMVQEPRRLGRRYLFQDVPFGLRLMSHALAVRLRTRASK